MNESPKDSRTDAPLNPALKRRTDETHDTSGSTPAPIDTASAKENEGEGWPVIWLVVAVISVIVAIYLIFF
jgi:hypothetical protein